MYSFVSADIVSTDGTYTIWREGKLLGFELKGEVREAESRLWRAALTAECIRAGYPRFLAFDMSHSEPRGSLANRVDVARYVYVLMKHVEWATLHTSRRLLPTSVSQAVRHLARVPNVTVTHEDQAFADAIVMMRGGQRPR
mgnify:CR=1 FL=1